MERYMLMDWRIQIVEMPTLFKTIFQFNAIPIKIPMAFFTELEQMILKFAYAYYRLQISKAMLKNNKARGIMLADFKLYYKLH